MSYKHLDVDKALENLGGSIRLYKIILDGFEERYGQIDQDITRLSKLGQFDDAERLSHTIKGLSGNLGAHQLREEAYILEKVYKNRTFTNEVEHLAAFGTELKKVILEINYLLEEISFDQEVAATREKS